MASKFDKPLSPQIEPILVVESQQPDRSPPAGSKSYDLSTLQPEVIDPFVLPGMKQQHDRARLWIDTGQIWAFVSVAPMAGEREVARVVVRLMLLSNDMLDMKRDERYGFLRY